METTEGAAVPTGGCRSCGAKVERFLDLGSTPLADALVAPERIGEPEARYPLEVGVCPACSLVQLLHEVPPQVLFVDNYLYFSSYADEVVSNAARHAERLVRERRLGAGSLVVEVASNDGYFLRQVQALGVPVLGIDPAPDQADAAEAAGVPTLRAFFGDDLARSLVSEGRRADVIVANNVMAHTPALNSFVEGLSILLADDGVATVENPWVRDLIASCAFDTIYHEHFSYFSTTAVKALVERHGLHLQRVEHLPLHGGTLRWTIGRRASAAEASVAAFLARERAEGVDRPDHYAAFGDRVVSLRDALVEVLCDLADASHDVAAYGAAAKGATLLNYADIGTDLVAYVVDRNPHKQELHMPGTHQPILDPAELLARRPDEVLLLAWNFRDEVLRQQAEYRAGGGRFVIPVPQVEVVA